MSDVRCAYMRSTAHPSCSRLPGNPASFEDARFEIEYLRIYSDGVAGPLHTHSMAATAVILAALALYF